MGIDMAMFLEAQKATVASFNEFVTLNENWLLKEVADGHYLKL